MKKKRALICILIGMIVLPGLFYLGLAIYYRDSFYFGTWINGIYCTGKTPTQVQQELEAAYQIPALSILSRDENGRETRDVLKPELLGLTCNFEPALEDYLSQQNPYRWIYRLFTGEVNYSLIPQMEIPADALENWFFDTAFRKAQKEGKQDRLFLELTDQGYVLREEKYPIWNNEEVLNAVRQALCEGESELIVDTDAFYSYAPETEEMKEIRRLFEIVDGFQNLDLTYEIKDIRRKVSPQEAALWIAVDEGGEILLDENGEPVVNEQAVRDFVATLANTYDNWQNHRFLTRDGRELLLSKGNYGIRISQKAETEYLLGRLEEADPEETVRVPVFLKDATYNNQQGIGDTYIEIDLTGQKLYVFRKGELELETDVVTGCKNRGMSTPEMVCYVYNKTRDTVLRGETYRAKVDYWVPVYKGIGIHDASWRSQFGEEIYIRNGSHGCINTPLDKMEELYQLTEIGMPVVIHQ